MRIGMKEGEREMGGKEGEKKSIQTLRQLNPLASTAVEQALLSFYMYILYIPQVLGIEN